MRTMVKLNIHEAKTHLSHYLELLEAGKEDAIVICRRNLPIAEIRAVPKERNVRRPVGLGRGSFTVPSTFFDPLPDDLLAAFEGAEK